MNSALNLLSKSGLKKTQLRLSLLNEMIGARGPLSQADLIQRLGRKRLSVDRVSIYRNLNQLKAAGLVHELESNSYVLCAHECTQHQHVLLVCQRCHGYREVKDHARIHAFMSALGPFKFFGPSGPMHVLGECESCSGHGV